MIIPILAAEPPPELAAGAHGSAHWLATRGIGEGAKVAVDTSDVVPWLLGADLLGAATLVVSPDWSPRERAAVLADTRPDIVVREIANEVVTGPAEPRAARVAAAGSAETLFYLATTSGSSGTPKVIARSRASWLRSFAALGPVPGPVLIAGPLSSSLFLFGALHALWCGRELQHRPRWDPAAAARAATVHLVPAMLTTLLDLVERDPAACALQTIVCGGAHLDDHLRTRLTRLLPRTELIEYYGSAEHSLIAIRRGAGGLRPVPGVDLDLRDGILWVRSPLALRGYLRSGELAPADAWTTVEDRAEVTPDGALRVLGRAGAMVSSGGALVSPEEVESVLRQVPGVADVLVTGTPHPRFGALVTAVVEAVPKHRPALSELRAAARANLEPGKRPRRWLLTTALPRTTSGKPARAQTADGVRDGTLTTEPWA